MRTIVDRIQETFGVHTMEAHWLGAKNGVDIYKHTSIPEEWGGEVLSSELTTFSDGTMESAVENPWMLLLTSSLRMERIFIGEDSDYDSVVREIRAAIRNRVTS